MFSCLILLSVLSAVYDQLWIRGPEIEVDTQWTTFAACPPKYIWPDSIQLFFVISVNPISVKLVFTIVTTTHQTENMPDLNLDSYWTGLLHRSVTIGITIRYHIKCILHDCGQLAQLNFISFSNVKLFVPRLGSMHAVSEKAYLSRNGLTWLETLHRLETAWKLLQGVLGDLASRLKSPKAPGSLGIPWDG
jgi:hypothetical protein